MKILLTGCGPFGAHGSNPSELAVAYLAATPTAARALEIATA